MQYGTFKKPYLAGNKNKPQYMEYKGGKKSVSGEAEAGSTKDIEDQTDEWCMFGPDYWNLDGWNGVYSCDTLSESDVWTQHFDDDDWECDYILY